MPELEEFGESGVGAGRMGQRTADSVRPGAGLSRRSVGNAANRETRGLGPQMERPIRREALHLLPRCQGKKREYFQQ